MSLSEIKFERKGSSVAVVGEWPKQALLAREMMLNRSPFMHMSHRGSDLVVFTVANGWAHYLVNGYRELDQMLEIELIKFGDGELPGE